MPEPLSEALRNGSRGKPGMTVWFGGFRNYNSALN